MHISLSADTDSHVYTLSPSCAVSDGGGTEDEATRVAHGFEHGHYDPLMGMDANVMTALCWLDPRPKCPPFTRSWYPSADGQTSFCVDALNYHVAPHCVNPIAIVVPGTGQDVRAAPTKRLVNILLRHDLAVLVLNYRGLHERKEGQEEEEKDGCQFQDMERGKKKNKYELENGHEKKGTGRLKLMHPAFTDDLHTLVQIVIEQHSHVEDVESRVSGRCSDVIQIHLCALAAASVPFDVQHCAAHLSAAWRAWVYGRPLALCVQRAVLKAIRHQGGSDYVDVSKIERMQSMRDVATHYAVPVFGFENADACFEAVDVRRRLRELRVPALVVQARDDPFYGHETKCCIPAQKEVHAAVRLHVTDDGGHCAFADGSSLQDADAGFFQREFVRWFTHFEESSLCQTD